MNDADLVFDIDVVEAAPRSRKSLRMVLVSCALASSATFLLTLQLETTTTTTALALVRRLAPAQTIAAPVVAPVVAPPVAVAVVPPPRPIDTPTPTPMSGPLAMPKRHAARTPPPARENMRSVMKEGSFALEWTGAAPVVATKQLTMVRDVDDDDIALVMRQRASAFRSCYESALRANADIAGSVDVTFTIDAAGSVQKPFVHPQAGLSLAAAAPLTRCVKDTLKRTRFAPVPSPTQVTRRLTFRRQTTI